MKKDSHLAGFSEPGHDFKLAFTVDYDIDDEICTVNVNDYISKLPAPDRIKVLRELVNIVGEALVDEEHAHQERQKYEADIKKRRTLLWG